MMVTGARVMLLCDLCATTISVCVADNNPEHVVDALEPATPKTQSCVDEDPECPVP